MSRITESTVEEAALDWLKGLGYAVVPAWGFRGRSILGPAGDGEDGADGI